MKPEHVRIPSDAGAVGVVLDRAHVAHVSVLSRRLKNEDMIRMLSVFRQEENWPYVLVAGHPARNGIIGGLAANEAGLEQLFRAACARMSDAAESSFTSVWLVWTAPAVIARLNAAAAEIQPTVGNA